MVRSIVFAVLLSLLMAQPHGAAAQSATAAHQGGRSAAKSAAVGTININTANVSELQALPGIGAKTAARIVEYRQKNGPFKKVEELMNVRGVGEKNFLKLKPQITIGTAKADHNGQL